jgi:4-oxalocrotonate tautomerase
MHKCPSRLNGNLKRLDGKACSFYLNKGVCSMPFIKVEAGKMDKETKERLISGLTKAASESLGVPQEAFTILLKENETDNWGVGGKVLTKVLAERGNIR